MLILLIIICGRFFYLAFNLPSGVDELAILGLILATISLVFSIAVRYININENRNLDSRFDSISERLDLLLSNLDAIENNNSQEINEIKTEIQVLKNMKSPSNSSSLFTINFISKNPNDLG